MKNVMLVFLILSVSCSSLIPLDGQDVSAPDAAQTVPDRPLKERSKGSKSYATFVNVFRLPAVLVVYVFGFMQVGPEVFDSGPDLFLDYESDR